jgi:hypothetical protein
VIEWADAVFMIGTILIGALVVAQILDWGRRK